MKTALFTGAGASKALGYPLTSEILPQVRKGLKEGNLFKGLNEADHAYIDMKRLRECLEGLFPGYATAQESALPLITDVFSLLEHAIATGDALPVGGQERLREFRDVLKRAITSVLLDRFLTACGDQRPAIPSNGVVQRRFAVWAARQGADLGMITTNYDIGLESVLYSQQTPPYSTSNIDLGFDWRDVADGAIRLRPANPRLRVYKLHGSLDVLRCSLCGHVYFNPWGAIAHQPFRHQLDEQNTCHCNDELKLELHIVAPSLVRDVRDANLLGVWRSAMEWMRLAQRWIIVGYSLPPEDLAIRSLLVRAFAGAKPKPEIIVVQRSTHEEARYRMLFGECDYRTGGFESFLESEAPTTTVPG